MSKKKAKKSAKHGGPRPGAGRPASDDPRVCLPFRLKRSVVEMAKALGRERVEAVIDGASAGVYLQNAPVEAAPTKNDE